MRLENIKLNMIIEAKTREAGINIAKAELYYIRQAQGIKTGIAKTSAYNINEKGFKYYRDKILNNDLIIESAGRLTDISIDDIEEFIINNGNKNIVCLIDIVNNFDTLVVKRPEFIKRFDIISDLNVTEEEQYRKEGELSSYENQQKEEKKCEVIKETKLVRQENNDIECKEQKTEVVKEEQKPLVQSDRGQKTNKTTTKENDLEYFVAMCRNYASNIDCVIPGKSIQALYNKIEEMINNNIPLTKENAVALIEKAADRAEKPKFGFSKKYDKNDCLILKEEHFK